MKKLLAVLLLLAVIVTVAACGKDEVDPPTESGSETSDTVVTSDTQDTSDTQGSGGATTNPTKDVWDSIDPDAVDDPDDTNWTPRL